MGRLLVIVTSPRVPAGLLSGAAWKALFGAARVYAAEQTSPATGRQPGQQSELVAAVRAQGVCVDLWPDATAQALLADAATGEDVVWLAGDDPDDALARGLAHVVVDRTSNGVAGPEVEIVIGSFDRPGSRLLDLVVVMEELRRSCPWDRTQTHASLVRYLLEETHETIEAIETGDHGHLREELGDLLLQVFFHARIAAEDSDAAFTIDDVAGGVVEKLIRRHPHVFADTEVADAAEVQVNWEEIKAVEKARESAMDGIPLGLPALSLAEKVVARAVASSAALGVPVPAETPYTAESLGDVLFALVAAARAAGIDPEQALRQRVRAEMTDVRGAEQRGLAGESGSSG